MKRRAWLDGLRTLGLTGGALSLVGLSGYTLASILRVDAFANFRSEGAPLGQEVGLTLTNVQMTTWEAGKPAAQAYVWQLTALRDRSMAELSQVKSGMAFKDGKPDFHFAAERATYAYFNRKMVGEGLTRVWNKSMNLKAERFEWDGGLQVMRVPGQVTGKLHGGDLVAQQLTYRADTEAFAMGPLAWRGPLPKEFGGQPSRKPWDFKSKGPSRSEGDVVVFRQCQATDGEVIVHADEVRYNRKTDEMVATGNVRYFGKDANLLCAKANVYRRDRRAIFVGDVTMLIKPKENRKVEVVEIPPFRPVVPDEIAAQRPPAPSDEKVDQVRDDTNLRAYPTQVRAERIEYWYGEGRRRAKIEGSPQAKQDIGPNDWRRAWAHEAFWDGEKERLRMLSRPGQKDARMLNSIGDDVRALWFEIDSQEEADVRNWDAEEVEGKLFVDEDELPDTETPPANPPGQGPPLQGPIGRT